MTCIVGLVDAGGKVWLGGDRAAVEDSHYLMHVAQPKVFRRGALLMGYTSSFRMGQLLQYRLEIPARKIGQPLDEWMVVQFAEAVRSCLKDGGYTKIENSREKVGCFLVGCEGRLFTFDAEHNVLEAHCGFDAVGSGISVARGALFATYEAGLAPSERLICALSAAAQFVTTVRPPFDLICEGQDEIYTTEAAAA